jgi:hypothetical protein
MPSTWGPSSYALGHLDRQLDIGTTSCGSASGTDRVLPLPIAPRARRRGKSYRYLATYRKGSRILGDRHALYISQVTGKRV